MNEFEKAFRKARDTGERFFFFKGKKYNTITRSEVKSGKTQSRQSKKSEEILSSLKTKGTKEVMDEKTGKKKNCIRFKLKT